MKWHNIRNGVNIIHRRRREEEEPYPHFTLPRSWSIAESTLPSSLIPEEKTNHNADSEYLCFRGVPYAIYLALPSIIRLKESHCGFNQRKRRRGKWTKTALPANNYILVYWYRWSTTFLQTTAVLRDCSAMPQYFVNARKLKGHFKSL